MSRNKESCRSDTEKGQRPDGMSRVPSVSGLSVEQEETRSGYDR